MRKIFAPLREKKSTMKTLLLSFFVAIFSFANAQTKFDQKLADSLGADQRGMKTYMLVILKTGPKDKEINDKKQRDELFKGHFSNMSEMVKAGKLKLAGPFATKNELAYRGIFLLDVKNEEEVKTLLQNDPTIKIGIFEVEILPWFGSAAIPMHLNYHEKISKENH